MLYHCQGFVNKLCFITFSSIDELIMITVRTRKKIGMLQQQLAGVKEQNFIVALGQNFLNFVEKHSVDGQHNDSILYSRMTKAVKNEDYLEIEKLFSKIELFGTYDNVTLLTTKYKNVKTAVGNAFNGTVYEGRPDEQGEIQKIAKHTCAFCSPEGDEVLKKLLA